MAHAHPGLEYSPFELSAERLKEYVVQYGSNPLFVDSASWVIDRNPYRRQIRPQVLPYLDFTRQLTREEILNYTSLTANRMLLSIYETDLMFLPPSGLEERFDDLQRFYSSETRMLGEMIRPALERHVFGFLDQAVEVSGPWTAAAMETYLEALGEEEDEDDEDGVALQAIRKSVNPGHAAVTYMIQLAGDFLSESSAMARNILGHYGPTQSELFKIVIDEYGYGVHRTKHSTLFQDTLRSMGLAAEPHAYWQFYLTSSLLLNNYFHYLCKNHELFFRYLGALYYTEATFSGICRRIGIMLRDVVGADVDVRYFTEHVHIDRHHGRMALEKLIKPVVAQYGPTVIPQILRGYEEFKVLSKIADQDFADQVAWSDGGSEYKELAQPVYESIVNGKVSPRVERFVEPRGELSNTHVHDGDELCYIVSGTMRFVTGHERSVLLHPGEGTVICRNRLHGAIIDSDECVYDIHSVGDYQACLS